MLKSSDMGWYDTPPSQNLSHDIPSTKGESNALETDRFVFSFKFKLNTKLYKVKRMPPQKPKHFHKVILLGNFGDLEHA